MKKLLAALFTSTALCAAPVGNPAAPQLIYEGFFTSCENWVDVRAGYEGDFVSDARLKQYNEGQGRVDCYEQTTNSGTLTINFVDRFDVFGVLGSSRTNAEWRFTDLDENVHQVKIETEYDFLWGIGGRAILFEWGNATLGCGGRYESAHYDPEWLTIDGINFSTANTSLKWHEWQIDIDLSYRIELLTPYIGIKYLNVKSQIGEFSVPISNTESGSDSFENRNPVGIFIGCSLSNNRYFMLNLEGRLIDEEAVTISGDVRF